MAWPATDRLLAQQSKQRVSVQFPGCTFIGLLTFIRFPAPQMVTRGCAFLECFNLLSKGHILWWGIFQFSFASRGQIERFGDSGSLRHSHLEEKKKDCSHYSHLTERDCESESEGSFHSFPLFKKGQHFNMTYKPLSMHDSHIKNCTR